MYIFSENSSISGSIEASPFISLWRWNQATRVGRLSKSSSHVTSFSLVSTCRTCRKLEDCLLLAKNICTRLSVCMCDLNARTGSAQHEQKMNELWKFVAMATEIWIHKNDVLFKFSCCIISLSNNQVEIVSVISEKYTFLHWDSLT